MVYFEEKPVHKIDFHGKDILLFMTETDKAMVERFRDLTLHLGVEQLIVYGSRARGDAHDNSDLDLAAIVTQKTEANEQKLYDAAYAAMAEFDFSPILSLKVFDKHTFEKHVADGLSFYRHVIEEGVLS